MDTTPPIILLLNLYALLVIFAGITALVIQVRSDMIEKTGNPLPGWRLLWSDAIALALGIVIFILALELALGSLLVAIDDRNWRLAIYALGLQVGLLGILLFAIKVLPRHFTLDFSPTKLTRVAICRSAFVQFIAALPLIWLISYIWRAILKFLESHDFGYYLQEQDLVALFGREQPVALIILMLVAAIIIAPITEELLFRGMLYRFLKSRLSARMAMVLSSVAFGAVHQNMLTFIPLTFLAMILVRSYERSGSLMVPILIHALFNANTLAILLLSMKFPELADAMK